MITEIKTQIEQQLSHLENSDDLAIVLSLIAFELALDRKPTKAFISLMYVLSSIKEAEFTKLDLQDSNIQCILNNKRYIFLGESELILHGNGHPSIWDRDQIVAKINSENPDDIL